MKRNLLAILLCVASIAASNSSFAQSTLLYFWNFNTWAPTYTATTPGVSIYANIPPDYAAPALSTSNAAWVDQTIPGTSAAFSSYADVTTDATDTVNAQLGDPAGNCFRARNPDDSLELLIYAPTTHYSNLQIKYGVESSSAANGDSANVFSYSVDSGASWITSGSGLSEWSAVADTYFVLVSVHVNDINAYNNPKFVFRINLVGKNSGTSGNNRFDNVTIFADTANPALGVSVLAAVTPTYTFYPNPAGNQLNVTASATGAKTIIISNMMGQKVYEDAKDNLHFSINTTDFATGIYYLNIKDEKTGEVSNMKFIKQ